MMKNQLKRIITKVGENIEVYLLAIMELRLMQM